jgi:hypothetical protein
VPVLDPDLAGRAGDEALAGEGQLAAHRIIRRRRRTRPAGAR